MVKLVRLLSILASLATASAPAVAQTIYAEDFTNGAPGWTLFSPMCCGVVWKVDGLPADAPNRPYHSAPFGLNFNNDVDYQGGFGTARADSPPIDLSLATGTPVLTFWCNDQMLEGTCDPHERTAVYVVGHASWQLGFINICDISCPKFAWHPHSFPLQAAWGVVQIRFEVRSDGLFDAAPGWFLDDVAVVDGPAPSTYCTGKQTSAFCVPDIAWGGALPSASDPEPCTFSCSGVVVNSLGMFLYGLNGPTAVPFLGGTLCLQPPFLRTFATSSQGTFGCSGYLALDFNAWIQGGSDPQLVPGQGFHGQWWFRDGASSFQTGLSDALATLVQP